MNRIKEARKAAGLSQDELGKALGVIRQTISTYEKGTSEPKESAWEEISKLTHYPVSYLKGESDDPVGWSLWEANTGFTREQIKAEINKLVAAHRINESEEIQDKITAAVASLNGVAFTNESVVEFVSKQLLELTNEAGDKFFDPAKIVAAQKKEGAQALPAMMYSDGSLLYDGMSNELFRQLSTILHDARTNVDKLKNQY